MIYFRSEKWQRVFYNDGLCANENYIIKLSLNFYQRTELIFMIFGTGNFVSDFYKLCKKIAIFFETL